MRMVKAGDIIRHYNGDEFVVKDLCRIEATLQTGVIYQSTKMGFDTLWVRPLSEIFEIVTYNSEKVSRYQIVK